MGLLGKGEMMYSSSTASQRSNTLRYVCILIAQIRQLSPQKVGGVIKEKLSSPFMVFTKSDCREHTEVP